MRQAAYLRRRYRMIMGYTGFIWLLTGSIIMLPVTAVFFYPDQVTAVWGFVGPGSLLALVGFLLWWWLAPTNPATLTLTEGAVIVVLTWLPTILVGTIPFILIESLTITQSMFESTSGWTTTGLSVIDVTRASPLILLYRSLIQFVGGAGFAIIMLTLLLGPSGKGFTGAEGRSEQLEPHVRRSANLVIRLYLAYAVVGIIGLYLAGMDWFDALNHAFAALSTGGFSTRPDSIGHWDSPIIEAFVIFLMLLGTTNFLTSYALVQGKVKAVRNHAEFRLMGFLLLVGLPLMLLFVTLGLYPTWEQAVRVAIFNTISAISTTGFSTATYTNWPPVGWLLLMTLMLIGGGGGSTAGGIKQYRIYILAKSTVWEMWRQLWPSGTVREPDMWQADRRYFLAGKDVRQAASMVCLHLTAFLLLSLVMAGHNYSLQESLFEAASTVSTVGLSVGVTAVDAPATMLWAQIVGMLLGRLEYLVVIVGIMKIAGDLRPR
jgi:trk system potassium uptake protein